MDGREDDLCGEAKPTCARYRTLDKHVGVPPYRASILAYTPEYIDFRHIIYRHTNNLNRFYGLLTYS